MKALILFILLLFVGFGYPFQALAQEANTTVVVSSENNEKKSKTIEISSYDNKIIVENAPADSKLEIYSVVGIRVKEIRLKQPAGEYPVNLAKGYYIVRIGETVRKIAIR